MGSGCVRHGILRDRKSQTKWGSTRYEANGLAFWHTGIKLEPKIKCPRRYVRLPLLMHLPIIKRQKCFSSPNKRCNFKWQLRLRMLHPEGNAVKAFIYIIVKEEKVKSKARSTKWHQQINSYARRTSITPLHLAYMHAHMHTNIFSLAWCWCPSIHHFAEQNNGIYRMHSFLISN